MQGSCEELSIAQLQRLDHQFREKFGYAYEASPIHTELLKQIAIMELRNRPEAAIENPGFEMRTV